MLCMAAEAAKQLGPHASEIANVEFRKVEFRRALQIPEGDDDIEVHTSLTKAQSEPRGKQWYTFQITSQLPECTEHCTGRVSIEFRTSSSTQSQTASRSSGELFSQHLSEISRRCSIDVEAVALYKAI